MNKRTLICLVGVLKPLRFPSPGEMSTDQPGKVAVGNAARNRPSSVGSIGRVEDFESFLLSLQITCLHHVSESVIGRHRFVIKRYNRRL